VLGLFVVGVADWWGEGVMPKSLSMSVRFIGKPLRWLPSFSFYSLEERGKKRNEIRVKVLGHWDVLSGITVRWNALKGSYFALL
jgi:hypothetical protein